MVQTVRADLCPILRHYPCDAIKEVVLGERMPGDYRLEALTVMKQTYSGVPVKPAQRAQGIHILLIN